MELENIKVVGVVGAGSMGSGIIQVVAQGGYQVKVVDAADAAWTRAEKTITTSLDRMLKKGTITEQDKLDTLARISFSTDYNTLSDAQLVIEAVFEDLKVKKELFLKLGPVVKDDAIIASNTSSISITEMAAMVKNPERFVGMHFFNPVPMMKLVEVIPAQQTKEETALVALEFAKSIGKTPIRCKDTPGFVVNRLLVPYMLDAARLLQDGVASAEDIDTAMKLGAGMPMGPFELQDFAGVEIGYYVAEIFCEMTKDPRFSPPTLLRNLTKAGYHGRKAGRGFYDYSNVEKK